MNPVEPSTPIAIIGIGCLFPRAADGERFWSNIVNRVDAIGDVPPSHWRPEDYFNADPKAPDLTYARRGGFLSPVDFPALDFGITPNALEATDSTQLLGLMVARQALDDAGYPVSREYDRSRVSVILGVTGTLPLVIPLGARLGHPIWRKALKDAGVADAVAEDVVGRIAESYVGWQEDSFPGLLGNVVAGRIANRLDLGGTNCVVDAACASSLSALHLAMYELAGGRADMVLTGGLDTFNDIFMYMCFSKTPALSPTGNAKPFDAGADGTILGEGIGTVVLKRLADAQRDGDRIYAVIKSVGTSSDGKGHAIYAPSSAGQVRCLKSAYRLAGITPDTIDLVEAHGTGTRAGDTAEATALAEVYRGAGKQARWCALGSIKSQIGHTKAAAGSAGLIKAALALHHKVLPPTIKVNEPIEPLRDERSPFYVNTEKRPWLPAADHPRRAAVSSFGFGGSNFHCVLEEYRPEKSVIDWDGDVQLVSFSGQTSGDLLKAVEAWPVKLPWPELRVEAARTRSAFRADAAWRLVLVLEREKTNLERLADSVRTAIDKLGDKKFVITPDGICIGKGPAAGQLGILFPGQGSQYVGMFRDLACRFPEVQSVLAEADSAFAAEASGAGRLSDRIFPPPTFRDEERKLDDKALRSTDVAQPALGAVSVSGLHVLAHFGVRAEAVAGHSYGELVALHAASRIDAMALRKLSLLRGRLMADGPGDRGAMLAVQAPVDTIEKLIREEGLKLVIANRNAPKQSVLSGASDEVRRAAEICNRRNISAKVLPVSAAFHSSFVAEVRRPFETALAEVPFTAATIPVFSNTTAWVYPHDPVQARGLLAGQLAEPVNFVEQIGNMYRSGVRTFLECGPSAKLTGLVGAILEGREHAAFSLDASSGQRSGLADLARTLAQLAALGHAVNLVPWDDGARRIERAVPKKPTLTVPISGANYVKPKAIRSPVKAAAATVPAPAPVQQPIAVVHQPAVIQSPVPQNPVTQKKPMAEPTPTPRLVTPSADPFLSQALRATQENLLALQKLGEQTANLHGQFLENQNRALAAFQDLLGQQVRLIQGGSIAAPAAVPTPLPALQAPPAPPPPPRVVAPAPPKPQVVLPPPAAIAPAPIPQAPVAPVQAPVVAPAVRTDDRTAKVLLDVVAEKTGYPAEMLALDMELDSDLGIDSIKRVEIFSVLQDKLPNAPAIKPEHLGSLRTLKHVVEFLGGATESAAPVAVAAPVVPPVVIAAVAPASSSDETSKLLLDVVADKTGYPAEMLALDMELDSDLGIDSIKRVEIFSVLQDKLPNAPAIKPEHLGSLRTLRNVVDFLGGSTNASPKPTEAPVAVPQPKAAPIAQSPPVLSDSDSVQRYRVQAKPLKGNARKNIKLAAGAEIWVTEEKSGLAALVVARLGLLGLQPRLIRWNELPSLQSPVRLAGLIILASPASDHLSFLHDSFRLLQLAGPALRKNGNGIFTTVSRLDGQFGLGASGNVLSGGLAGLAKTAALEWPEVRCKALDVAAALSDEDAALAIGEELVLAGPVEVGISSNGRTVLEVGTAPQSAGDWSPKLGKGDVVLVSGGARGVTAECAVALGRMIGPTLVLLGRSAEPTAEPDWLAPLKDEGEIKKALLARAGGQGAPREIGDKCKAALANREMLQTLERIRATGAPVHYRRVDVRDAQAVRAVVEEVRRIAGPIRGVVHGAGVVADRKIEDKTTEQFAAVYATKVGGLSALLQATETDDLKVLALFSSSTGRFGRVGQVDYAVANEVLNKHAQDQARCRPGCRVVALNWGPWDGGMVTPALKGVFQNEGIGLIPLAAGAEQFVREISTSSDRAVEVVVMGGKTLPTGPTTVVPATPALGVAFERELSIDLMPMALTVEWLAHGAMHGNPGLGFHGFDDLRILKGVRLAENHTHKLRVLAGKAVKQEAGYQVPVELQGTGADGRTLTHARATILLASRLPQPPSAAPTIATLPYPRDKQEIYRDILFHGTDLQGLERIEGVSDQGAICSVPAAAVPSAWIADPLRGAWLADPLALDCAFQLMIVWSYENFGSVSLPACAARYRQYRRSFPREGVRILARITRSNSQRSMADLWFTDQSGAVVASMEGYECVIDASLNQAFRRNQLLPEALPSA